MKNSFFTTRAIVSIIVAIVIILIGISIYQNNNAKMSDNYAGSSTSTTRDTSASSTATTTPATVTPLSTSTSTASTKTASNGPSNSSAYSYSSTRTLGWSLYTNAQYGFNLKYPPTADTRDFIDGAGKSYGTAVTIPQSTGFYSEKYFELTVETVGTTVCEALPQFGNTKVTINGNVFNRTEYEDDTASGSSHVAQYLFKNGSNCYKGYLRLNGPRFTPSALDAKAKAAAISSESQVLEDIMHTVIINQ